MMRADAVLQQICPKCNRNVSVNHRFITWCECGWNVEAMHAEAPKNRLEALYVKLGQSYGNALFQEMLRHGVDHQRNFTKANILAYFIATCVFVFNISLLGLGIYWTFSGWQNHIAAGIAGTIFLFFIIWIQWPRIHKLDKDVIPLSPEKFPVFTKLVQDVSAYLGVSKVHGIYMNKSFNAYFTRVGLRRRKYFCFGLPLLKTLEPEEIIALIGHEVAHDAHNDLGRESYVHLAVHSLRQWYSIAQPARDKIWELSTFGYLHYINYFIMKLFSWIPYSGLYILTHLMWNESQRSEFLADLRGSEVSGTEAYMNQQHKMYYAATFYNSLHRYALNREHMNISFFDFYQQELTTIPEREIERIRRVERMEGTRLDATHPPTAQRITLLEQSSFQYPKITLTPDDVAKLVQELTLLESVIEEELIEDYLASLQ
ncbi:hypothetical protein BVG16_17165 [Paenibacillus selenitireducens]|uniref:Peptidase M48 domain-containing protein n=1 Tax=Paenibacillus selenitireducens TaxID=1324314 RepID=A0A1T2XAM0_9BACL|nr:M48 family metallopeptidase [Paenibacillus selenitireducens]OPA76880.1 hypothetical protein BVG16_17165 [Paenibacillus selenitireducens]